MPTKKNFKTGFLRRLGRWFKKQNRAEQLLLIILALLMFNLSGMYALAKWYKARHAHEPLTWGVTFIPSYAADFGLDPNETLSALINDLGVRRLRLVSYWEDIEPEPGQYDFSQLDSEFKLAEAAGAKVSLAIGLRQPRWPECHMPGWAARLPKSEWSVRLKDYMKVVIEHYQNSPALQEYQLENEFFMQVFGICPDFSRSRLIDEFNFVKSLDHTHPVLIARSNNWVGLPLGRPRPDEFAISVYKRVWDKAITHRYYEYPLPAWFYGGLAGGAELLTGRSMIIHELQAEPWAPNELSIKDISIAEQNKSMDAKRLAARMEYAKATGMRTIDLWGGEWWYWRKVKFNDSSLWNAVKEQLSKTATQNKTIY